MILRILNIITAVILMIGVLFAASVLLTPMGSGDRNRCKQIEHDLFTMSSDQLTKKYYGSYSSINCEDGTLTVISQDSHSSWWGGNLVIKTEDNSCIMYTGHVCGPSYPLTLYRRMQIESEYFGYPLLVADFIYQLDEKMQRYHNTSEKSAVKTTSLP